MISCPKCGMKVGSKARFCSRCGKELKKYPCISIRADADTKKEYHRLRRESGLKSNEFFRRVVNYAAKHMGDIKTQ